MRRAHAQRGVALLTAIILVALTVIIAAAIVFNTGMMARRASSAFAFDQAAQFAGGAEAIAATALDPKNRKSANEDTEEDPWAQPFGPVEVAPEVQLQAQVVDLSGRFNLNSLVDVQGNKNPKAYDVFVRLLEQLKLDPKWADMILDWIDADSQASPQGAEDAIYTSESPPYRAPNFAITDVSELLALKGFGADNYALLKDYVAALPRSGALNSTPINLCTASAPLLDALANFTQFNQAGGLKNLARLRQGKCFPQPGDLKTWNLKEYPDFEAQIGIGKTSQYFRLTSLIGIGTSHFALYSFLQRGNSAPGGSQIVVLSRHFTD